MRKLVDGPFEVESKRDQENEWHDIIGPILGRSGVVADTLNRDHCITPDESASIARLFAAAPDLLAACESALIPLKEAWAAQVSGNDIWPVFAQIKDAIAKAKGGAS